MAKDDLDQLGWTLEDFGISREDYFKRDEPTEGFSPNYTAGVSGGYNQTPKSGISKALPAAVPTPDPSEFMPSTETSMDAINMGLINPQDQSPVQDYLDDQSMFEQVTTRTKTFLGNLFDTEDKKESAAESVWDGFLTGVGWVYDRISQVSVAGLSALPGGIRTLSWDEADEVSVGQVAATNAALSMRSIEEGNYLEGITGLAGAGPIAGFASLISPDVIGSDFDITNEQERQRAFEEDPLGKWTSGLTDAVFTIAADPLIVGGKALKVTRIRWVDQPIVSQKQVNELVTTLNKDKALIAKGETENLSSQGSFLNWVGQEGRTYDEVYNHVAVRDAAGRDELTSLLVNADNFDQRALVMRVAYGDPRARQELINARADLADAWGKKQRERLEVLMAARPQDVNKIKSFYKQKAEDLDVEYQSLVDANAPQSALDSALRKRDKYIDLATDLEAGKIFRDPLANPLTKEEVALAKTVVNDFYVSRDNYLRKAIEGEYAFVEGNKQVAANNVMGRMVERSRQRRAVASAEMEGATFKNIWKSTDYSPLGKAGRTVRLWRWFGKEKPAGYIVTRGSNIQEQYREIRANLNNIDIYNLPAKTQKINGKDVLVGGKERREELVRRYMDAVGSSVEDQNKISLAVNMLEQQIIKDMAMWHGMDVDTANTLIGKTFAKRKELIENIRKNGFWVDEDGTVQKAPYLESQLQNGTYLLNYRAINRAMAVAEKDGTMAALRSGAQYGAEKAATAYDIFNSIWRPSVLLRLGYAQRNYVEGVFRSSAFIGSLAPLAYTGKQAGLGFRNFAVGADWKIAGKSVVKGAVVREAERVEKLLKTNPDKVAGTRFAKWRDTQIDAAKTRIAGETKWLEDNRAMLRTLDKNTEEYAVASKNIEIIEAQLNDVKTNLRLLESKDQYAALALYRGQAGRKRRVFDGEYEREDPFLSYKAFGNPRFTDIAWGNMSADATTRATLTLRMQTSETLFKSTVNKNYVAVTPDKGDAYFDGVAEMLKQFRASEVGRRIINGDDPKAIAAWLRTDETGKEIVRFLNGNIGPKKGKQKTIIDEPIRTFDDALDYVLKTQERFNELTPNPALKAVMLDDRAVLNKNFGKEVKRLLDTDEYRDSLVPAIGNIALETGWKSIRDTANSAVQEAFRWLGTLPEDAFVRAPFYGRRYQDTRATLMRQLEQEYKGKTVPFAEIAKRERIAHRRALKDTKDWLYTIERRTNLGHYGEFLIPFISATQNSVTALGRLTWRDPSIIGVVNLLWQAPNRAGMEDENGNIVLPIPYELIPDGIEEATGLDNMRNIRVNKMSLNVVFPETGYGFIPRPGPLFAVPASEMMKKGFLGMSVETPTLLREFFGEEAANELWDNWRKYVFGEESGLSAESLSWNMWTPPAAAKIVQMLQGEGSSTSYLSLIHI